MCREEVSVARIETKDFLYRSASRRTTSLAIIAGYRRLILTYRYWVCFLSICGMAFLMISGQGRTSDIIGRIWISTSIVNRMQWCCFIMRTLSKTILRVILELLWPYVVTWARNMSSCPISYFHSLSSCTNMEKPYVLTKMKARSTTSRSEGRLEPKSDRN